MPLDLSNRALGLPDVGNLPGAASDATASSPWDNPKQPALNLSDEALGLPKPPVEGAAGFMDEVKALGQGVYGLGSSSYAALKGIYKGSIAAAAGLSFGDVFSEEFDKTSKNAADAYKPLAPEGNTIVQKSMDLITQGIHGAGAMVFEKGLPIGPMSTPKHPVEYGAGKGSPTVAAGTEVALTAALLLLGGKKKGAAEKPGIKPGPTTWEDFAASYPESAKAIDASSLGSVRFHRADTSVLDAVTRQMDTELGLSGEAAKLPFETKAAMVFDKVAPQVPLGEKLNAVAALKKKVGALDAARESLANTRGLPQPAAISTKPIEVTAEGQAITPKQAADLAEQFRTGTPSANADALGLSVMGQLKQQYRNMAKHAEGTPEYNMERAALERMFKQAFPDALGKRVDAFDRFMNFKGDVSYSQVLDAMGKEQKPAARAWRKYEGGAIDIEGMDYLLNSFKDLPNQKVLKRATIVGQLNRQGVPQAEKDVVLRALGDKDSISQSELVGNVAMNVLPLKPREMKLSPSDALERMPDIYKLGIKPGAANIRVWDSPVKHGIDLNHPEIYGDSGVAHTRYFDRGYGSTKPRLEVMQREDFDSYAVYGPKLRQVSPTFKTIDEARDWKANKLSEPSGITRSIAEIQSDLMQAGGLDVSKDATTALEQMRQHPEIGFHKLVTSGLLDRLPVYPASATRQGVMEALSIAQIQGSRLKSLVPLEKRWYERILMEENRLAAREGISKMRVPTPETVAKVEFFPGNTYPMEGVHKLSKDVYVAGSKVNQVEIRGPGGTRQDVILHLDNGKEISVWDLNAKDSQAILDQLPRGAPKNQQTILDFYKRSVLPFARSRFGAKDVMDEYGNTWLEWPVNPADATKKIPAFGGRQRGIIDIPGWEDAKQAQESTVQAAKQTAERGWAVGGVANDQLYAKTQKAFAASRAAEVEGRNVTMRGMLKKARSEIVAHDYDLRGELERAGPYGEKAVERMTLQNGATMAAKSRMDAIVENIFSELDTKTKLQVDEMMRLRRIIEIDSYKGIGKHKHPEGITGPQAEAVALRMQKELGKDQFARVYETTNRIMAEYKGILNRRMESGLLSEESYLKLLHFDYSPTEFIDLIDPVQTFKVHGRPITVRTSGVPYLERGKKGRVVMDSELLLAEALVRSENLIFKNATLQQLHELATKAPENGVVRLPAKNTVGKAGTPDAYMKHTPRGQVALGVRSAGKQEFVLMREDLAEQFIHRPQVMPELVGTVARIASGTSLVKATATTYNPAFVVSGLPMDVLHTWLATSDVYSPHLPKFLGQMAVDLAETGRDAWTKGPEYQQALREGIGSAFMTHEGRGFSGITDRSISVAEKQMMPRFDKLKGALSYVNESADIWVRMAHRHRLIKQGVPSWEATGQARNRLDYSAGGQLTRAVDTVVPYSNVAVQALSKVVKAGAKDPVDFTTKLAWAGGAIAAWQMANMIASPETWDQWYIMDPDGNKRYVYFNGVRLDAVAEPLAATIISGLELAEYGRPPDSIASQAASNLNPVFGFTAPPAINAIQTYLSNYDSYTGRQITPRFGQVLPQNEGQPYGRGQQSSLISRAVGGAVGMSPPRLDAAARKTMNTNNIYLQLMGWGLKELFEGDDPRVQSEATTQIFINNPAVRPFVRLTNPSSQFLRDIGNKRETEGSRRKQMTDSVDNLLFQVRKGQATTKDVQTYIKNQPGEDRQWLTNYATTAYKVKEIMKHFGASEGVPNETWWRAVASLPARPRAQEFYSQWLTASSEDRKRMERIATSLHNAGAGFYSDDFRRELARERALLGTEQR
jgi:hypothetical protein